VNATALRLSSPRRRFAHTNAYADAAVDHSNHHHHHHHRRHRHRRRRRCRRHRRCRRRRPPRCPRRPRRRRRRRRRRRIDDVVAAVARGRRYVTYAVSRKGGLPGGLYLPTPCAESGRTVEKEGVGPSGRQRAEKTTSRTEIAGVSGRTSGSRFLVHVRSLAPASLPSTLIVRITSSQCGALLHRAILARSLSFDWLRARARTRLRQEPKLTRRARCC